MQFLRATLLLFSSHLSRTLLSKRALICVGIVTLPVLASLLVVLIAEHEGPAPALPIGWMLQVQFVVPLVSLIVGSAVVAEEVENRTITYLFTRPIPRSSVLLGRWLASLVLLAALLASSSWVVTQVLQRAARGSLEEGIDPDVLPRLLITILLGGAVYSAVFAALGALIKRSIIVGLAYTFAVEGFLANLPGANQKITILYYLKSYLVHGDPAVEDSLGRDFVPIELVSGDEALRMLFLIMVGALALGAWTIRRKQYVLPA